jgi:hypothetical protein
MPSKRNRVKSRSDHSNQDAVGSIQKPLTWTRPRNLDSQIYRCVKTIPMTSIASNGATGVTTAQYFALSSVGDVSSLTNVFDQYRITLVEVLFVPRNSNNTSSVNPGRLTTVIDYDDASGLGSEAEAFDYSNAITTSGFDQQRRVFVPHMAMAAYSGTFTSYANLSNQWIDCSSTTVQHYGIKAYWSLADGTYTTDILARLHLEFKNVR